MEDQDQYIVICMDEGELVLATRKVFSKADVETYLSTISASRDAKAVHARDGVNFRPSNELVANESAIERLEKLKAEYEIELNAFFQPSSYYDRRKAKVDGIQVSIDCLRG